MRREFARARLGDIAHIEMGQAPDSSSVFDVDGVAIPFLQGNAEFGARHPTAQYACASPRKTCEPGDILISVRAPVGALNIADRAYCIGRGLAAIRIHGMPPTLAAQVIALNMSVLRQVAQGTTFEAVNKSDIHGLSLAVPFEHDYLRLTEIIDTLDTTIRQTEAIIEKLKQVKQGLLHDLLTRGIDANGELRPPQSEAPHRYKRSALGPIPTEWSVSTIAGLADNLDGRRIPIKETERKPGIHPYYGASGVIDWVDRYILDGDYVLLGEDGENVLSRRLPLAFRVTGKIWVNNHAHVYQPKHGVDIRFLVEILEAKDYAPWVSGSAQPKLTQDAMARVLFVRPPSCEQTAIASRLEGIACRAKAEIQQAMKLRELKSGLMDDLLTGRVRVTPLLEAATA